MNEAVSVFPFSASSALLFHFIAGLNSRREEEIPRVTQVLLKLALWDKDNVADALEVILLRAVSAAPGG